MLTNFCIITAATAGATVLWRTLIDDHPALKRAVCRIPLFGQSLSCGICTSFWFSLIAMLANPLAQWSAPTIFLPALTTFLAQWLTLGLSVLFVRSVVLSSVDVAAIFKHWHAQTHQPH